MGIENNSIENKSNLPKIERITINDLRPEVPKPDETIVVLQRHAKDSRDPNSPLELGTLIPESAEQVRKKTKEFFDQIFKSLGPEKIKNLDILVVASNTKLTTPMPDVKSEHKRAMETGEVVIAEIKKSMAEFSLPQVQLLNKSGRPIELSSGRIGELHMFEDSPEFVNFLRNKYGIGKEFWVAFEDDAEKETRERLGAEGPDEVADRLKDYLKTLANAMKLYHQLHPNRRMIVWAISHYDTISPFIKRHVAGMPKTDYLPIDNGAGIVINIKKDQKASAEISGNYYDLSLFSSEAK